MSIGDIDFRSQVELGILGRVFTLTIAFLGSILLARILGPDGYGLFYYWMAIATMLDNPVTGWATACRKRLTEVDFPSGEAFGSSVLVAVGSIVPITVLLWLVQPVLLNGSRSEWDWAFVALLYLGASMYFSNIEILKSTHRFGMSTWMDASRDVVRVVFQGTLVLLGYGVAGMVGGIVLANLLLVPVIVYFIGVRPSLPSTSSFEEIWRFAKSSIPGGILGTALSRLDILLLGILATKPSVGNYQVAFNLTMPAMFIAGTAASGLVGRVSNLESRDKPYTQDINNNLKFVSVLAIPLFFGAVILGREVAITVYGSEYVLAGSFLVGLAFYRVLNTQDAILKALLSGLDRPDLNLRVTAVTFVVNLVLGVYLLMVMGPIGVIVATVLAQGVAYSFRAYLASSMVRELTLLPRTVLEQVGAGLIMAGFVWAGSRLAPLGNWLVILAIVGIGALVYGVVLLAISSEHRHLFRSVAESRLGI